MTKNEFERKVSDFFISDEISRYHLSREGDSEIGYHKYYCYLKKCVIDCRERNILEPLNELLRFLDNKENKKYVAEKLMDPSLQEAGECWSSGNHEYLLRSLIIDVLQRSAGMVGGIESHKEDYCLLPSYDWLDIQFEIRSPTKALFFKNNADTIASGHIGAVKGRPDGKRVKGEYFRVTGSEEFHTDLINAFYASTTLNGFIKRINNAVKEHTISGKRIPAADTDTNYVITGIATSDKYSINLFRRHHIKPAYKNINELCDNAKQRVLEFDGLEDTASISSIESDRSATAEEEYALEEEETLNAIARLFM